MKGGSKLEELLSNYWDTLMSRDERPCMGTRVDFDQAKSALVEACGGEVESRAALFARTVPEQIAYEMGKKDEEI